MINILFILDVLKVVGLNTNIEFLKSVVSHPVFIQGEIETGFIDVGFYYFVFAFYQIIF